MENLFKNLEDMLNPFPKNPLQIFSLVDKVRSKATGTDMLSGFIRQSIRSTENYYRIIYEVKEMALQNESLMIGILGEALTEEILKYEIPEYLIKH